jgi:F0F1-type ATP synthase assembly protein I
MVSGGVAGLLIGWLLGVFRLVEPLVSVALPGVGAWSSVRSSARASAWSRTR